MLFKVWEGGMSFHGGLLGVLRRGVVVVAPATPAVSSTWSISSRRWCRPGSGFGRVGNCIGGELWGKPTQGTAFDGWGVVFPRSLPEPFASMDAATLQACSSKAASSTASRAIPSQLYQATLEGLVMFCVLGWYSRKPRPRYAVSGLFALLYGCFRFLVEFVREPDAQLGYLAFGWLTMGQVLSLPLILLGLFLVLEVAQLAHVDAAARRGDREVMRRAGDKP